MLPQKDCDDYITVMRTFQLAALLLLPLICAAGFQDYPRVPKEAIVKLYKVDERGQHFEQGTGVVISPDGWVLTVAHAVTFSAGLTKVDIAGKEHDATAVYMTNAHCFDLALVKIDAHDAPHLEVEQESPQVNETVFSVGYPRGAYKWSSGFILRYLEGDRNTGFVMTSFVSDRGASGSPLINLRRKVCGILTTAGFDYKGEPVSNFWIPAWQIQQLIDDAREAGKIRPTK